MHGLGTRLIKSMHAGSLHVTATGSYSEFQCIYNSIICDPVPL